MVCENTSTLRVKSEELIYHLISGVPEHSRFLLQSYNYHEAGKGERRNFTERSEKHSNCNPLNFFSVCK